MLLQSDMAYAEKHHLPEIGWRFSVESNGLTVVFDADQKIISSAVNGGGWSRVRHYLNARIDSECPIKHQTIAQFVENELIARKLPDDTLVMMTAASMKSLRVCTRQVEGEWLVVMLTSGMANARRAGDKADYPHLYDDVAEVGTVNMLIGTSAYLSDAAMVESVMIATEAKCTVMQQQNIMSPISNAAATGTGTDSIAVSCPAESEKRMVTFVGKHTIFGETLACLVQKALTDSLKFFPQPPS